MSTSGFVVVRLDPLDLDERQTAMRNATAWLLEQRILAPLADSLWHLREHALGAWGPGPNWHTDAADPLPDAWLSSVGEEVDISADRQVHSAIGTPTGARRRQSRG